MGWQEAAKSVRLADSGHNAAGASPKSSGRGSGSPGPGKKWDHDRSRGGVDLSTNVVS